MSWGCMDGICGMVSHAKPRPTRMSKWELELEVMLLLKRDLTDLVIARRLHASPRTVRRIREDHGIATSLERKRSND